MVAVRVEIARCALIAILVAGCRGERKEPPAVPHDEPLAWPALDEPSLLAVAATGGFAYGTPVPLAITPDGAVVFRRARPRDPGAELYQLDPAGKTSLVATAAALWSAVPASSGAPAGAAAPADGIQAIEVSDDGGRLLVPLAGRLFAIERATGASRELALGAHRDPSLSPDGKRVAFVRDGDLWIAELGAPAVRIAQHPADREYATPDPAAPDFGRRRGYWWAPDSQSIAFQRTDARAMDTVHLADPHHPEQAPAAVKRARSGRPIAVVDIGVVSIHGGAPRWVTWELPRYPYLARVIWPAKGPLTLIVVGREQTQLAVLAVDPATGGTRPLLVDKDPAWINVAPDALTWLADGSGFLWTTESHGSRGLDHHAADGTLVRQVVTADVGLHRVVGLSPDGRELIIEAAADPREQHIWRIPLAGGAPVALTQDGGVHRAWSGHGVLVIDSARRAGGHITVVIRGDGTRVELPSVAERPKLAPTTKLVSVTLDDHLQDAAVTRPRGFDPKVRYPVVLRIESAPGVKAVRDAADTYQLDQWLADAGFVVVRTDGRGTPGRDRSWEAAIAGDVLTIPMNDQLGALKRLGAQEPALDVGRTGALGTGFGGYLATLGATIHPEVFAAAVAVSPITDWDRLDAAYSERYMKTPATNPDGYRRAGASTYAEQLTRPLLLVHAITGERIPFADTLALVEALSAAGKRVELVTLPSGGDAGRAVLRTKLIVEFLRAHLGPPVRPGVMPRPRTEEEEEAEERKQRK